jgi:cytochrome c oxidase assembly protein subunit 20
MPSSPSILVPAPQDFTYSVQSGLLSLPNIIMAEDSRKAAAQKLDEEEQAALQQQLDERRARHKRRKDFPQTQAGKLWDAFYDPNNPVNEMPGGTYNSAGGKPKEVTWRDAFNFDKLDPKMPWFFQTGCGRDSLLVGMGAGGAVGGVHFILRGLFESS